MKYILIIEISNSRQRPLFRVRLFPKSIWFGMSKTNWEGSTNGNNILIPIWTIMISFLWSVRILIASTISQVMRGGPDSVELSRFTRLHSTSLMKLIRNVLLGMGLNGWTWHVTNNCTISLAQFLPTTPIVKGAQYSQVA